MEFDKERASIELVKKRISKTRLADEIGVSRQQVHKYLSGLQTPPEDKRRAMEKVLSLEAGSLEARSEEAPESGEINEALLFDVIHTVEAEIAERDLSVTPEQRAAIVSAAYRHARAINRVDARMVHDLFVLASV